MLSGRLCLGLLSWHRHGNSKAVSERCWTLIKDRLAGIRVRYSTSLEADVWGGRRRQHALLLG